jgi:DNA processing protein
MSLKTDEIVLKRKAVIMAITGEGGIGPKMFQQLLMHVGPPEDLVGATQADLEDIPRFRKERIEQLLKSLNNVDDYAGKINDYMSNEIQTTCILDDDYPDSLRSIDSPPPILYYRGDKSAWSRECVALVGTTKATQGGLRLAVDVAKEMVRRGYGIVSGLAAGIDSAAHLGALKEQGATIAVLGSGILEIYPEENKPLADLVARSGLLISEHQPFKKVSKAALVLRNRIISALAKAVVVVQVGAETQGELHTAAYAAEQARPLFYGDPDKDLDYERFKKWPGIIIDSADSVDEIINYMV